MEYEDEPNISFMELSGCELELQGLPDMNSNDSIQISLDAENLLTTTSHIEYEDNDVEMRSIENTLLENDNNEEIGMKEEQIEADEEEQGVVVQEEAEEGEISLHKIQNIDTQGSIKMEIKQLLVAKVTEEITSTSLRDNVEDMEELAAFLQKETQVLEKEHQGLDVLAKADEERTLQMQSLLTKTNEMIAYLKDKMDKIDFQLENNNIDKLILNWNNILDKVRLLKTNCTVTVNDHKNDLEKMQNEWKDKKERLQQELSRKTAILQDKTDYLNYLEKLKYYNNNIKNYCIQRKQRLEQNCQYLDETKQILHNETIEQQQNLQEILLSKDKFINKLHGLQTEVQCLENRISEISLEDDDNNLETIQNELTGKMEEIRIYEEKLENVNNDNKNVLEKMQEICLENNKKLEESTTKINTMNATNHLIQKDTNELKSKILELCQKKTLAMEKKMELEKKYEALKLVSHKKKIENEEGKQQLENKKIQLEKASILLKNLDEQIKQQEETNSEKIEENNKKIEMDQANYQKIINESQRKREYYMVNSNFLQENLKALTQSNTKLEEKKNKILNELAADKLLLMEKKKNINEFQEKLRKLDDNFNKTNHNLSSSSSKKVTFNDVVSFKSPSSSEVSNATQNVSSALLDNSFHDWLNSISAKTSNCEEIEEEV